MISQETVDSWISSGKDQNAVAGRGTSVESLSILIKTGKLPWQAPSENMLPYQSELVRDGGYLYYSYPFVESLRCYNPEVVAQIEGRENVNLTEEVISRSLRGYAVEAAISDLFFRRTGKMVYPSQIVDMAAILFPELILPYKEDEWIHRARIFQWNWFEQESTPTFSGSNLSLESLRGYLEEGLKRRGVIVYFNGSITKHRLFPGQELDEELMILAKEPLTGEVVSGLELLSYLDREALAHTFATP